MRMFAFVQLADTQFFIKQTTTREILLRLWVEERVKLGHAIILTHIRITMTACILTEMSPQLGTNAAILLVTGLMDPGALQRIQTWDGKCAIFHSVLVSVYTSAYYVCLIYAADITKTTALIERRTLPKQICPGSSVEIRTWIQMSSKMIKFSRRSEQTWAKL